MTSYPEHVYDDIGKAYPRKNLILADKAGLELEGFEVGKCLPPIGPVSEEALAVVRSVLQDLQLI